MVVATLAITLFMLFSMQDSDAQALTNIDLPLQGPYPGITPTFTPTFTPTPTPTPTPTATSNLTYLQVISVTPAEADRSFATNITVIGDGFQATPILKLGNYQLTDVRFINSRQLTAVVPSGLPVGIYDLFVINPGGATVLLAQGFSVTDEGPSINFMLPTQSIAGVETTLNLYGQNFAENAVVRFGGQTLLPEWIDATYLRVTLPSTLAAGDYAVVVQNLDGGTATAPTLYTLLSDLNNDDLYASSNQLWTDPLSPRSAGSSDVGLVVTRQGGKQPIGNVTVRFYVGNPNAGGQLLGDGAIDLLSPRSSDSTTSVEWTPSAPGAYTLYALIDPDSTVPEALEGNNVVSRTLTVLPPAADQIAPRVDSFTINDGAAATTAQDVRLNTTASDPAPSSGIQSLLIQEFEYSQGANQWVPVRNSGWLDYQTTRLSYAWRLLPSAGVKYLQAWASDRSGNISVFPFKARINYIPPTDRVGFNQGRAYRYTFQQGDRVVVTLTPVSGDPDLYVWTPNPDAPPYVSNLSGTVVDTVDFIAAQGGEYQVEVYGYSAAEYRLSVEVNPVGARHNAGSLGGEDLQKEQLTAPLISLNSTPATQQVLPTAPTAADAPLRSLYLPAISR